MKIKGFMSCGGGGVRCRFGIVVYAVVGGGGVRGRDVGGVRGGRWWWCTW